MTNKRTTVNQRSGMKTINENWWPHPRTVSALIKAGYSQEQITKISNAFVARYQKTAIEDDARTFTKMVRSSGPGHNVIPPPNEAKNIIKENKKTLKNRALGGLERARKIKEQRNNDKINKRAEEMIMERWG